MRSSRRLSLQRERFMVATAVVATMVAAPAHAGPCDGTLVRTNDAVGANGGYCGTVASEALDDRGRFVAGECSYDAQPLGTTVAVTITAAATAQRVLPSDEDPLGRLTPVALTTRCVLRSAATDAFVVDVQSGSPVTGAATTHAWTTRVPASSAPFTVCVEVTAVWGDFDAAWTPFACLPPS